MAHHRKTRKRLLIGLAIAVAVWLVALATIILVGNRLETGGQQNSYGSIEGRFESSLQVEYNGSTYGYRENSISTLLIIGIDKEDVTSGSGYRSGGQADFLMLAVIDRTNRTVTPVQIDRDTITWIRIYGSFGGITGYRNTQLCLAQAFGNTPTVNCENTAWAVSNLLLGIPIDDYIAIDMSAISVLNDALGGVTVTVEDDLTTIDPSLYQGATVTLKGSLAERYVRARMYVSDGTNASRMRRQRGYLTAMQQVLTEKLSADSDFAGELYDLLGTDLVTDMTKATLINKAYQINRYATQTTEVLTGVYSIGSDGFREFAPDEAAMKELILRLCFTPVTRQ